MLQQGAGPQLVLPRSALLISTKYSHDVCRYQRPPSSKYSSISTISSPIFGKSVSTPHGFQLAVLTSIKTASTGVYRYSDKSDQTTASTKPAGCFLSYKLIVCVFFCAYRSVLLLLYTVKRLVWEASTRNIFRYMLAHHSTASFTVHSAISSDPVPANTHATHSIV